MWRFWLGWVIDYMDKDVIIFGDKRIRRVWHDEDWFYSVVDVVGVLSESFRPRKYWGDLRKKLLLEGFQLSDFIGQLKMLSGDGKMYVTDCANMKGIFRIIQSIPSKRAEPFKIWLAKVGSERIDEMEDPELSIDRAMKNYLAKGYSEKWINQRLKTIEVRRELTDEWKRVGVEEGQEFAVLTNEITLAWSGKSVGEYKNFKSLRKENLRDNMTNLELVLNMLAEVSTKELSENKDPVSFEENIKVARDGGSVARVAREKLEGQLGEEVISSRNSKNIHFKKNILEKNN